MTVSSTTYKNSYTASGGQTVFPYTFRILDQTHVKVFQNDTLLTLSTHYTVSGVGEATGGNITLVTGATVNDSIVIVRDVPLKQESDYTYNDKFPSETHETALDKLTMIVQQLQEQLDRATLLAPSSTAGQLTLPDPSASKVIGYNSAGTALTLYDVATIGAVFAVDDSAPPSYLNDAIGGSSGSGSSILAARSDHRHRIGLTNKQIPFSIGQDSPTTGDSKFRWENTEKTLLIGDDLSGDIPVGQQWGKLHIGHTVTPNLSDTFKNVWIKLLANGTTNAIVWAGVNEFYHDLTGATSDSASFSAFSYRGFITATARGWTRALEGQTYLYETGTHDPAYSIELGMHTKSVNTEAHGIYLWSGDQGGVTYARAGDALRIWGDRGWNRGILYLDTDGSTVLFAVGQNGDIECNNDIAFRSGAGFNGTLSHANTAARQYNFPDVTGTVSMIDTNETITGTKVFTQNLETQQQLIFKSATSFQGIFDHAITASRTWVLPDAAGTIALLGLAQTWTAIQTHSVNIVLDNGAALSNQLAINSSGHNAGLIDNNAGWFRLRSGSEEKFAVDVDNSPTSGNTAARITYHNGSAVTVQLITVGATDSGGAGFKLLRVPN